MNMKKVLAAVVAVMMAVSAMAINVFAEDITIDMGVQASTQVAEGTLTWTIPVSNMYGYLTEGTEITFTLPKQAFLENWWFQVLDAEWTLNGYKLAKFDYTTENVVANGSAGTYEAKVKIGVVGHDYIDALGYTTVPQDTIVLGTQALTLSVTAKWASNMWALSETGAQSSKDVASFAVKTAGGFEQTVPAAAWGTPVRTHSDGYNYTAFNFVDSLYNNAATDINAANVKFEWDHTLANKAAIVGAESAKVVVTLAKPVTGVMTYTLWAKNEEAYVDTTVNDWLDYEATREAVATVNVNGTTDKLEFEVPLKTLYDSTYGTWNTAFAITEDITNVYNVLLVENGVVTKYVNPNLVNNITKDGAGTLGNLSWVTDSNGNLVGSYLGAELNYAADAKATSVALVLSAGAAEDTTVEVVDPVEPATEEEEDTTVDATEEPEENPETGLALAVVPMLVAAAAVVASKRR